MSQQTVGEFLFEYMYNQGAHHAFGIPGDFALPTFRWLEKSKIKLYTMTHEPSVGFAADGYARINDIGLACVTYCVGGLNMLNSIACAYAEKSPVVVVSGGPSPNDRKNDPLMHHKVRTFDTQQRIYDEVTCASAVLLDPETAADEIIRVVSEVKIQSRPGYIEVPYDVVDMPIKPPTLKNRPVPESNREMLEEMLAEAAEAINAAKQPVIIADVELHRYGLTDVALAFAQKFNIPIASTLISKSLIPETNPLYIGVYSAALSEPVTQEYVESSDCIILLGAFLSDVFSGFHATHQLDRKKTILATSDKMRIGLHAYEKVLLKDFLSGLEARKDIKAKSFKNPYHLSALKKLDADEHKDMLTADSFFRILALTIDPKATIVSDTGDALFGAVGLRTTDTNNFLSDAYYLSMGFAVPASIGAHIAKPDSRVYCLVGDGAFQMTGLELSTCAKYKLKPIICILNNDGYGTQRFIIDGPFNNIHRWEYAKLRDVLNYGKSCKVTTKGELEKALKDARDSDEMHIIEVIIPKTDISAPLQRLTKNLSEIRDATKRTA